MTTWRATAIANTVNSEFGQTEDKIVVAKDLLVRLILPRFLVENDVVTVTGIVHNYTDKPVTARVSLDAGGLEVVGLKDSLPTGMCAVQAGGKMISSGYVNRGNPSRNQELPDDKGIKTEHPKKSYHNLKHNHGEHQFVSQNQPVEINSKIESYDSPQQEIHAADHQVLNNYHPDITNTQDKSSHTPHQTNKSGEHQVLSYNHSNETVVHLKPGEMKEVEWVVKASKTGNAKFVVKAVAENETDAMQLTIPVYPYGIKVVESAAGSCDEEMELTLKMAKTANPRSASLRINLSPSLAGGVIEALDYLAKYPYGCIEQTMNRFIPNAIVQRALKELGLRNESLEKELPAMMKRGFKKIYDYQHKDGGWGWWKDDDSRPMMSALVVYGLSLAKNAGYDVDKTALLKGSLYLKGQLTKVKTINEKVYILFALSENNIKMKYHTLKFFNCINKMDNYTKALMAMILFRHGEKEKAKTVLGELEKRAEIKGNFAAWKGRGKRSWSDNPVETTAYVVRAFLMIDPENPIIEKGIRYLSISRKNRDWYSTKDTAAAILAVLEYVKHTGEMNPDFDATLFFNGRELKKVHFTKNDIATGGVVLEIPGERLIAGENKIKVVKKGSGRSYCTALLTQYLEKSTIKPLDKGFKVKRRYFLVTNKKDPRVKGKKTLKYNEYYNENRNEVLLPLDPKKPFVVKSQDIIEVELAVEGEEGMEYVMIEDKKPAGCEYLSEKEGQTYRWFCRREFRDNRVVYFIPEMWNKSQKFYYRMRAETPGTYKILPATASLMYLPEVNGRSGDGVIKVTNK